jgi:hypothetical protein
MNTHSSLRPAKSTRNRMFTFFRPAVVVASLLAIPVVKTLPANASGVCGIYGSPLTSSGLTVTRVTGNCDLVGAKVRYSEDNVTFYWSTPGYGYYSGTSGWDTSRYYADQTWGWSGSGWSEV